MTERHLRALEWAALAVAVLVRLAALRTFQGTAWAEHPMVDAYTYWEQAQALLAGKDPFEEGYYQPPAYPVLLALLGKVAGGVSLLGVRLVQQGLGLLTAWLLLRLGRRLGEPLGAPWAGAASALLYSLYPTTLFFELDVLTPALTSACLAGALALLGLDEARPAWRTGLAGLLVGLAVAAHPTYLLVALVVAGWLAWQHRTSAVLFVAALALPLLPTTVANLRDTGTFTLVSHNAGVNFYLGNNPAWRTTVFLRPGLPFRELILEADPATRDLPARNAYWKARAISELSPHLDAWGAALLTKAYWSVHDTEIYRNEDYRCRTRPGQALRWMGLLPVRWGWVFPLAVAGLGLAWRRGGALGRLLGPAWLALQLPMGLFLVADRYRLATWPVVVLLAPLGLRALVLAARGRRFTRPWLVVLAAAVLPWLPIDRRTQLDPSLCDYAEGNLHYMEENWALAQAAYERVLAVRPDDVGAHSWLGYLAERREDEADAIRHFEAVAAAFPAHFPTLKELGRLCEKQGDLDCAVRYYRQAYEVPGDRTPTGALLVRVLVKAGRADEARALVARDAKLAAHPRVKEALSQ